LVFGLFYQWMKKGRFLFGSVSLTFLFILGISECSASPLACEPGKQDRLAEKVFLHIDRSSYSPGDIIWFKAYIIYGNPSDREHLSKVVFVDLIDSTGIRVDLSIVKIEDSFAVGQLDVPGTLQPGNYSVRAYTEWMSAFDVEYSFVQPVVIEKKNFSKGIITDDHIRFENLDNEQISVTTNKAIFTPREKLTVNIASIGDFHTSISVTDITLDDDSSYFDYGASFSTDFELTMADTVVSSLSDGVRNEVAFKVNGQFLHGARLTFINCVTGEASFENLNEQGITWVDVKSPDSSAFLVHAEALGRVEMPKTKVIVPLNFRRANPLQTVSQVAMARLNRVDTSRFVLLDDVTIRASRTKNLSAPISVDYSFSDDKLHQVKRGVNVLFFLANIPGVQVISNEEGQYLLFSRSGPEVFPVGLFINGMRSQPNDVFTLIGDDVDRIDAFKSLGRVTVFIETTRKQRSSNFQVLKLRGFDVAREFLPVDHASVNDPFFDDRRTLYWNANFSLTPGKHDLQFFASDLPGRYKVRVVGISPSGLLTTAFAYFVVE